MEEQLIDKFQELIDYICTKKTEATMAFRRLNTDPKKIDRFKQIFMNIKEFMDCQLEEYGGVIDGEEQKHAQEFKDPQDQIYENIRKQDLNLVKEEIINYFQKQLSSSLEGIFEIKEFLKLMNEQVNNMKENKNIRQLIKKLDESMKLMIEDSKNVKARSLTENDLRQIQTLLEQQSDQMKSMNTIISQINVLLPTHVQELPQNIVEEEKESYNVQQIGQSSSSYELLISSVLTNEIKHEGERAYVVMVCENGNIAVGGGCTNHLHQYHLDEDDFEEIICKLNLYKKDGSLVTHRAFTNSIQCGLAIGELLYIYVQGNQITVLDSITLETQKQIDIQSNAFKLFLTDNLLFVGQSLGNLDLINIQTQKTFYKCKLSHSNIYDIIKLADDEYAFACQQGLFIFYFDLIAELICSTPIERYLENQRVNVLQNINSNIILAGIEDKDYLFLIDRESQEFLMQIGESNKNFNCIERIIGYDEQTFPYVIVKDRLNITILNTKTFKNECVIKCSYGYTGCQNSMVQREENNQISLYTLQGAYNQLKVRVYTIATKKKQ